MDNFKKISTLMSKPWVIISFTALIILSYLYIDLPMAEYFYQLDLNHHIPPLKFITILGKAGIYVGIFAVIALFFRYILPNPIQEFRAWFLLLCILVPNTVCLILKTILGRARPDMWFDFHQFGFYWLKISRMYWSFPSSHTTTIMGLFIGFSILFPRYIGIFLIPTILVIASRILLYQHFLSDILVAMYLTVIELAILVYCLKVHGWIFSALKGVNYARISRKTKQFS